MPDSITQIGVVTIAHGAATADGPNGSRPLTAESPVYADDVIKTIGSGSAVEIKLNDGALLSQGPDSSIVLDDYVFDADQSAGEMTIRLLQGTLRSVTGEIVDHNPEGFKIETPLATIGIRGTTTGHVIGADGQEEHVVVDFVDRAVVIGQASGSGLRVITQDGMGVSATGAGLGAVRPAPPNIMSNLDQLSSSSMQQGAPTFQGNETGDEEENEQGDNGTPTEGDEGQEAQGEGQGEPTGEAQGQGEAGEPAAQPQEVELGLPPQVAVAPPPPPPPVAPVVAPVETAPPPAETPPPPPEEEETTEEVVVTYSPLPTALYLTWKTDDMTVDLSAAPSTVQETDDASTLYTIGDSYQHVYGSSTNNNIITGDGRANILQGGAAADTISGGSGNDTISGQGGNDSLIGGDGDDVASFVDVDEGVTVTVNGTATYTGTTATLEEFEHITGSTHDDVIYGNSDDNRLRGHDGEDFLWGGGGGDDTLYGGHGKDTFKLHGDTLPGGGTIEGGTNTDALYVYSDNTYDLTGMDSIIELEEITFKTTGGNLILQATDFVTDDYNVFDGVSGLAVDAEVGDTTAGGQYVEIKSSTTVDDDGVRTEETIDISAWTFGSNWEANSGYIKLTGDVGNETFGLGANMSSDIHIDGGDISDSDTLTFTDNGDGTDDIDNVRNIQNIVLGNADTSVTTVCDTVTSDFTLTVDGRAIESDHTFIWDGSAETDSAFKIYGGAGQNSLIGGQGADTFVLTYDLVSSSTLTGGSGANRLIIDGDVTIDNTSSINNLYEVELTDGSKFTMQWDDLTPYEGADSLFGTSGGDAETLAFTETTGGNVNLDLTANAPSFVNWTGNTIQINGGAGDNIIDSVDQASAINGGNGDDFITGGNATDTLTGGSGNDTFNYMSASQTGDIVTDFGVGADKFWVNNFTGLNDGAISSNDFARVTSSYTGDEGVLGSEGFIYEVVDDDTGKLWYDDDTNTVGGEVLIAEITQATSGTGGEVEYTDIECYAT